MLFLAGAFVSSGLSGAAGAQQPAITTPPEVTRGTFVAGGERVRAEFGTLSVPENRDNPANRTLELQFVRLKSTAAHPGSPIVYLPDGAASSGIDAARRDYGRVLVSLRQIADVIVVDSRGTGASARLFCPDDDVALPVDQPGSPERFTPLLRKAAFNCVRRLQEQGIDLGGYTPFAVADDLADLRTALGADRLTIWGVGFGARVALAAARRYPAHIDRLILTSVEGPDQAEPLPSTVDSVYRAVQGLAAADRARPDLPDVVETTERLLSALDSAPVTVEAIPGQRVTVGRWDLQKWLADMLGTQAGMERIPAELRALARGQFGTLGRWALGYRRSPRVRSAVALAMECASIAGGAQAADRPQPAPGLLLGDAFGYPLPEMCEVPGLRRLEDDWGPPAQVDAPVLFVSGTLDVGSPPRHAAEVSAGFSFSDFRRLAIQDGAAGDPLVLSSPAIVQVMIRFLGDEEVTDTVLPGPEWTFDPPSDRSLAEAVLERLHATSLAATVDWYHRLRRESGDGAGYDFREVVLNRLGYELLRAQEIELALQVFRLNTEAYPGGFNTWDSLGEAYLVAGDLPMAVLNYRKSLALNPDNTNAHAILARLRPERAPERPSRRR